MCGRFTLTVDGDAIFEAFDWLKEPDDGFFAQEEEWARPRYNIAPTQPVPVIGQRTDEQPALAWFRWGLVPFFSKDAKGAGRMINARIETVHQRNSFREPYKRRRCLIPADGWFEWKPTPKGSPKPKTPKQPILARLPGHDLFTFAGIWDRWKNEDGTRLYTFSILTRPSQGRVADVHPRMPVVVPMDLRKPWVDPNVDVSSRDLRAALLDVPPPQWEVKRVSSRVNNFRNDDPACLDAP